MRKLNTGVLALSVLGIFYIWRNRFQIQRLLSSYGIDLPIKATSDGSLVDDVKSAASKVAGNVQNQVRTARTARTQAS